MRRPGAGGLPGDGCRRTSQEGGEGACPQEVAGALGRVKLSQEERPKDGTENLALGRWAWPKARGFCWMFRTLLWTRQTTCDERWQGTVGVRRACEPQAPPTGPS